MRQKLIPMIKGTIKDPRITVSEIPFLNLASLVADEKLVSGNPNFYHVARPEQLERWVRDELGLFVIPSTQHDLPIAPNRLTAGKDPDGCLAVAGRQATYDAYLGARATHSLQTYGQAEPGFDGNAYTFSSINHGGQLQLYTSHSAQPVIPRGQPDYHVNHIRSFAMCDTAETWRLGATWFRNSMDLAREMRDEAVNGVNDVVNRVPVTTFASNTGARFAFTGTRLELDSLTMNSQAETAQSVSGEDFQIAARSQAEVEAEEGEEEDGEPRPSLSVPAKRSGRSRRQVDPRRKRRNRDDSKGIGSTLLSSQEAILQACSLAAKKGKEK